jgi:hypothetical protein
MLYILNLYVYKKKTFHKEGQIIIKLMEKLDNLIVPPRRLNLIFFNVTKRVKVGNSLTLSLNLI